MNFSFNKFLVDNSRNNKTINSEHHSPSRPIGSPELDESIELTSRNINPYLAIFNNSVSAQAV